MDKRETVAGDASKLREALESIYIDAQYICDNREEAMLVEHRANRIERTVNAALSAKPRNCDVGTVAEQNERYKRFCARHYQANNVDAQCDACPCKEERWDCELEWAQMPYAAEKEGGDHADAR